MGKIEFKDQIHFTSNGLWDNTQDYFSGVRLIVSWVVKTLYCLIILHRLQWRVMAKNTSASAHIKMATNKNTKLSSEIFCPQMLSLKLFTLSGIFCSMSLSHEFLMLSIPQDIISCFAMVTKYVGLERKKNSSRLKECYTLFPPFILGNLTEQEASHNLTNLWCFIASDAMTGLAKFNKPFCQICEPVDS